jgi:hypothetical protein
MIVIALLIAATPPVPTECAACHKTSAWEHVTFAHDKTGFPLKGAHAKLPCGECHTRGLEQPLTQACATCHKDPHAGTLGTFCESCHEQETFRSAFSADAHRKSNFPLIGKHAVIPCEQCHGPQRERIFSRAPARCIDCHRADYEGTAGTGVDHQAAGFPTECRQCHSVSRFQPALFLAHDRCFLVTGPPHAGIPCKTCHTSVPGTTVSGTCSTGTAACTACHAHPCSTTNEQHKAVPGYQCNDRSCYECHRLSR